MCLTDVATNRVTVVQPAGYDENDYEILFRAIETGQTTGFWKTSAMPNGKTDSNNASGISCDFVGRNYSERAPGHPDYWDWSTLDHAARAALASEHRAWQLGLIWSVQNHPRVPQAVKDTWGIWGLCADEFTDNDHWPYNLYVREARRMISDYVMTQSNALATVRVPDSVGMGAYTLDSHNTQRFLSGSQVKNEGDIQASVPNPYPIAYRSIVPATGECENLLVPWCTSSSHIAFGSIRMEPVFMCLGQSAATAACLALDEGVSVQQLNYAKLSLQLLANGQILSLNAPEATPLEAWLFAYDEKGTEGVQANDPAAVTLARTGSTVAALDLILNVGGSATQGIDYPAFPVPVTIPAGKAGITIPITALWDDEIEPDEIIEVGLVLPDGYMAGASTNATLTIHDSPPVTYAGITFASTTQISSGSNFDLSVYPEKAGYNGLVSGVFGDGTVEGYQLFRNEPDPGGGNIIVPYAFGGVPVSLPTYGAVTTFAEFERGDVWTISDPDSDPADFGGATPTISGAYNVSGTIDVSGLSKGTVYVLVGGYNNPFYVDMTLDGEGEWFLEASAPETAPPLTRNLYVVAFTFDNAWGRYDSVTYHYTGSAPNRSRFMGVIVDAHAHPLVDYGNWSGGYLPTVIGGPGVDFDLDGLTNDEERLWGLDPTEPGSTRPSVSRFDRESGTFYYTRRDPALTGATYQYQWSTTLVPPDWQPFTPEAVSLEEFGPLQTLCLTPAPALLVHPLLYLRVIATP
jgi:hypothetical protein